MFRLPEHYMPTSPRLPRMVGNLARLVAGGVLLILTLLGAGGCAATTTTLHDPIGVVECEFADQNGITELPLSYYQDLFRPGPRSVYDYFNQVSYHQVALDATILGPFTVGGAYTSQYYPSSSPNTPMTLNQYMGLDRIDKIKVCLGAAADAGKDLTHYQEPIALEVNQERLAAYANPVTKALKLVTNLTAPAGSTATTLQVQSSAGFPTSPFPAYIADAAAKATEEVIVTGESGSGNTTWTVSRGFEGSTALALNAGDTVSTAFSSDIGTPTGGIQQLTVGSSHTERVSAGLMAMDPLGNTTAVAHEIGHGLFDMNHSRDLSAPKLDYTDYYDVMSGVQYIYTLEPAFAVQAGYTQTKEQYTWAAGPGLDSVALDYLKWLSPVQEDTGLLESRSCASHGITLDALSQSQGDDLEARLPYTSQPGFPANGLYYTIEFRNPTQGNGNTLWDSAIPRPTVLVHLAVKPTPGADPYISYLVDTALDGATIRGADAGGATGTPAFVTGSSYVDPTSDAYMAVNSINGATGKAVVTIGTCLLATAVAYVGDVSERADGTALLAANLSTNPTEGISAPVPSVSVTLYLGAHASGNLTSCTAVTDASGHVACSVRVPPQITGYTQVTASFAGTVAYASSTATAQFKSTNPTPPALGTPPGQG